MCTPGEGTEPRTFGRLNTGASRKDRRMLRSIWQQRPFLFCNTLRLRDTKGGAIVLTAKGGSPRKRDRHGLRTTDQRRRRLLEGNQV